MKFLWPFLFRIYVFLFVQKILFTRKGRANRMKMNGHRMNNCRISTESVTVVAKSYCAHKYYCIIHSRHINETFSLSIYYLENTMFDLHLSKFAKILRFFGCVWIKLQLEYIERLQIWYLIFYIYIRNEKAKTQGYSKQHSLHIQWGQ